MTAKPHAEEDQRIVISVRNVSKKRWLAISKLAKEQFRMMPGVLDEMMDDFLSKYNRKP